MTTKEEAKYYSDVRTIEKHSDINGNPINVLSLGVLESSIERYKKERKIKAINISNDILLDCYNKIKEILQEYMDLREDHYSIVAVWIIGTYFHKQFSSYSYLFFNAMKGSGKTRLLKIIAELSKNGKLAGSMTEAVLFRTAGLRTLCIDEIEGINAQGNENLRLLLNSAYKKGLSVERLTKRKSKEGEEQCVESFEVYCPIALANIWGMENVLSDRCISLVLEKSSKDQITRLIENFDQDIHFQEVKKKLNELTKNLDKNTNYFGEIFQQWNSYVKNIVNKVKEVSEVNIINKVNNKGDIDDIDYIDDHRELFSDIYKTELSGRDLELFFPLFIIAHLISPEVLKEVLNTAQLISKERKQSDREENRDVQLIEFIAQSSYEGYIDIAQIVKDLKIEYGEAEKWINSRGISRALKRLNLVLARRSTGKVKQVKINISKAQEKLLLFKEPEKQLERDSKREIKESSIPQSSLDLIKKVDL